MDASRRQTSRNKNMEPGLGWKDTIIAVLTAANQCFFALAGKIGAFLRGGGEYDERI
jgi:hypothetical protein